MVYVALALIPVLILMVWLYTRDSIHPEPKKMVYRLFLRGAAIVLPAGLLERALLDNGFGFGLPFQATGTLPAALMTGFFVAGLVEEFLKAAIVERSALDKGYARGPIDCLVYAGATALGFAAVENILYVTGSGFSTALLRSVTAVPAHMMFGLIMGTFFARAKFFGKSRAWAYLVPAMAHGLYDTFALSNSWLSDGLLVLYLAALLEYCLKQLDWARKKGSSTV